MGLVILPGSSGWRKDVIGEAIFKTWAFLCLPPWKAGAPAVPHYDVDERYSGGGGQKKRFGLNSDCVWLG